MILQAFHFPSDKTSKLRSQQISMSPFFYKLFILCVVLIFLMLVFSWIKSKQDSSIEVFKVSLKKKTLFCRIKNYAIAVLFTILRKKIFFVLNKIRDALERFFSVSPFFFNLMNFHSALSIQYPCSSLNKIAV